MLNYLILVLAVLRLYYLFAFDLGPGSILLKFRLGIGVKYINGQPVHSNGLSYVILCEYCAPLYYSLVLVALYTLYPIYTIIGASVLALSMVAIIAVKLLGYIGV